MKHFKTDTFVVLGDGLSAGVSHFSLSEDVQKWSFPALVAKQLGTDFAQPLIQVPGLGNVGFQHTHTMVPDMFQTTVLSEFPRAKADLKNLSVPGFSLSDVRNRRPRLPLIQTKDPKQTLVNLILGVPSLTEAGANPPTQLEYARALNPDLVMVCLGYQEMLEPLVEGHLHGNDRADLANFARDYAYTLKKLGELDANILVCTIPNPLDTAYFSNSETAANILRTTASFLEEQYSLAEGDLISLDGLLEMGYQFTARQITGNLPEGSILSEKAAEAVRRGLDILNETVISKARKQGAQVFDLHGYFERVCREGAQVDKKQLSGDFLGGFYLLNGVFPGRTGHALIANELIAFVNQTYQTTYEKVDVAAIADEDANTMSKLADGPTYTDEFLVPRTWEDMPGLPAADPSMINTYPPYDPSKLNIFPIQTFYTEPPFDVGGKKKAAGCVSGVGVPAGGLSEPRLEKTLILPESMEMTVTLNKAGSYFGDALRAIDFPDEEEFLPGLPTFGAGGDVLFGGLVMTDSHLTGKINIKFSEPNCQGVARFEITHPGGLIGDDGVLAAPKFFRMPAQLNRVDDVPGLVSSGELNLNTGWVTNFHYNVFFRNTQVLTLFNAINPEIPTLPLTFPWFPNLGSTWARFDQREDGGLDITMAANLSLPLGKEFQGNTVRFPLPFATPDLRTASIMGRGTSIHPHIHLTSVAEPEASTDNPPEIPVNCIREFTPFIRRNSFGDVFGLHIDELDGEATGRAHLNGRLRFQFGPKSGDCVPFALNFLPPGGLLSELPEMLSYLPPGTSRGMISANEQLKFPSGVTYNQKKLSSACDPNNIALGMIDLKTGKILDEFLCRCFVVQKLFENLIVVERCTPGDSFNYQGAAQFESGPNGELLFAFNGNVVIPYPKGFKFPMPTDDGQPGFEVVRASRLDPFLRLMAMHAPNPIRNVFDNGEGETQTSSIGEEFFFRYKVSANPDKCGEAQFEYTNHTDKGTFKLTALYWLSATNSRNSEAGAEAADTLTFTGGGSWQEEGQDPDDILHQVSVQVSTAADEPYVMILVDAGTVSNVNTKPADINDSLPL